MTQHYKNAVLKLKEV